MPTADQKSFKAMVPFAIVQIPGMTPDQQPTTFGFRMDKLGYMTIFEIIMSAPTLAPVFTALMEAVISGKAADEKSLTAVLTGSLGDQGVSDFAFKALREFPDTIFDLLIRGMKPHLQFAEGEDIKDFILFLQTLDIEQQMDLLLDFYHLNLPGGFGPFVAAFKRLKGSMPAAVQARLQPNANNIKASGTPSIEPVSN